MNREKKKNGDDKTSINQLLTAIFIYSSIFFAAGLTYDIVLYTLDAKWFLLAANTAALLMMGAVFAVYAAGKTDSDIALFANMLIVTLNLAVPSSTRESSTGRTPRSPYCWECASAPCR